MKVEIHDVDHGACAVITSPEGHRLMIDCGKSATRFWYPSIAYRDRRIDTLLIQNLDEDHVEDLYGLWTSCPIGAVVSNPTIGAATLRQLKRNEMGLGVYQAHEILRHHGPLAGPWQQSLGSIHWRSFYNAYGTEFVDTNNLSLATFVSDGNVVVLFGGDLEVAGWKRLLRNPEFVRCLPYVDILIASHHGRENGACDDLFVWCKPKLIIFSDGPKQYGTQETASWYATKASGIPDWTRPKLPLGLQPQRRVMTTRKDGTIRIEVGRDGAWRAYANPRAANGDHPYADIARRLDDLSRKYGLG